MRFRKLSVGLASVLLLYHYLFFFANNSFDMIPPAVNLWLFIENPSSICYY
ncbi:MAG: YSIRK-type signal peptide-containing protein [Clostridia bacterium]|nr:YSIRK-type signal peptide-containing protein [Clostridia bacterium]